MEKTIKAIRLANADILDQCLYTGSIAKHEGDYPLVFFWGEQAEQVSRLVGDKIKDSKVWNFVFRTRLDQEAKQVERVRILPDQVEGLLLPEEVGAGDQLIKFLGLGLDMGSTPIFESTDSLRVQIASLGRIRTQDLEFN